MTVTASDLEAAVDAVVGQDVGLLSVAELQERIAVLSRQAQRLTGCTALAMAELERRTGGRLPTEDGRSRSVAGWAAEATGDSAASAGRLSRIADDLQTALPLIAQAVLDGELPFKKAEILTRLVGQIDAADLRAAEPELLTSAALMDPVQLAAYVRHLLATWVEPVVEEQENAASARRYLKTRTDSDGSLWGSFRLAAGDSESVLTVLEPLARPQGLNDARSAGQRRGDALVEVFEQVLRHGDLPAAGGQRPRLAYVLPADWAARQAGEHSCPDCRRCPQHAPVTFAELVAAGVPGKRPMQGPAQGSGQGAGWAGTDSLSDGRRVPVPAEHGCAVAGWTGPQTRARIETILCDARITRVLLDTLGQVQGLESLTDSVTPAQRRALAARDVGCAVRGCTRPPAMCDAHHLQARADGGPTTLANLVLLCRRHHVLWHLGKLTLHHLHVPWINDPHQTGPPPAPPPRPRTPDDTPAAVLSLPPAPR